MANYGIGVQGIDLTAVTPPRETAQANAIGGTIADSSYRAVSKVRNNILAIKNGVLSILSPQLSVIGQLSGLSWPHSVTGVEAFPIDLDNDGNIGAYEDSDGDSMTSAQETFDLALVLTADGIVVVDVTIPQSPEKMEMIPVPTGRIVVDREKRLAYTNTLHVISLKDLKPLSDPAAYGVKRDFDNDGIDDRVLYTMPQASGFDMVLSDNGTVAYVADYSGGEVKIVGVGLAVVKLEAVSVDADNPSYVKVNYRVIPADVTLDTVTFSAPGTTQTRSNVSGEFYFTFNQNDLPLSSISTISLTATKFNGSITEEITANRERKVTPQAQKIVMAYFLAAGVGVRTYAHKLTEIYHQVSYSVPYSGKTIWVGESIAALELGGDYDKIKDIDWDETHKYDYSGGSTGTQFMAVRVGLGNPNTRYKESNSNLWPETNGLTGIATVESLTYRHTTGVTPAMPILNAEVDRSIP